MTKYELKKVKTYREKKIGEDGHIMFEGDVLRRLQRLAYLEDQIVQNDKLKTLIRVENAYVEDSEGLAGRVKEMWITKDEFDRIKQITGKS